MEVVAAPPAKGIATFYGAKIEELESTLQVRRQNLKRLEAQRNELNTKVRAIRDELHQLHEPGSMVGEVIKVMGKNKVLVKQNPEGKYVVEIDKDIDINDVKPNLRVALKNENYALHKILPNSVDPLVSLMRVEKAPDSTYDQIGGLERQVKEIKEVVELPIKHPELFDSLGVAQPKGVLLYGPPGTGKTLLARAVAHHTDCTFIRVSGSELVQKYIGEGSRMVRELFVMAREHAPSIIFMDEVDSIGSSRLEGGSGGGDSEVQRTMLELLNQLDGFEAANNIKVIMATNRIDILDAALLRPGRIDRKIEFPNPTESARRDILRIHSRRMNLVRGIDLQKVADSMGGASGAESKAVCTEAGMYALRERRVHVTQEDFQMAVTKVMKKDIDKDSSAARLFNAEAEKANDDGNDFFEEGKFEAAIESYSQAITLSQLYSWAYCNRAAVHLAQGETDKAIEDYSAVVDIDPTDSAGYNGRAFARAQKADPDLDASLKDCDQAIKLDPGNGAAFCTRGFIHMRLGNIDDAITDQRRAMDLEPKAQEPKDYLKELLAMKEESEQEGGGMRASFVGGQKRGWLSKKGGLKDGERNWVKGGRRNWKRRWFQLEGVELTWTSDSKANSALGKMSITKEAKFEDEEENRFCVHTEERDLHLIAADAADKREWVAALVKAQETLT